MKKVFYLLLFFLTSASICAIFPYPIISRYTNITQNEAYQINNYREIEMSSKAHMQTKILALDFKQMDSLLPIGSQFEIYDMKTAQNFCVVRTGGEHHFDIEPCDQTNAQILQQIAQENNLNENKIWSWTRHPVLVKMNDFAFLPASIAYYPHGYTSQNQTNGHFCLHFSGSKTDGTKAIDDSHQKCVSYAEKHGYEFIEKNIG